MTIWEMLFGTPSRAPETLNAWCAKLESCWGCPMHNPSCDVERYETVEDWLREESA